MTTKTELLQIISKQCVMCCGGSYSEIKACKGGKRTNEYTVYYLHLFHFGIDILAEVSDAKKDVGRKLVATRIAKSKDLEQPVS